MKSDIELILTTAENPEEKDIKNGEEFVSPDFTQTFQIRNKGETPVNEISVQVDSPSHYAQKELVRFRSASIVLNDGSIIKCSIDQRIQLETIGRSGPDLPKEIDCVSTQGVRCSEIR